MAALVVVNPNRFRLPNAATKKAVRIVDYSYTIQIFRKENNSDNLLKSDGKRYNKFKIMEKYLIYILAGFLGGIVRGLVGFTKSKTLEKINHFKPSYFMLTILIAGIVGAAAGVLADTEWQVSFLAGYAGTDFIENLYKIKLIKPIK